MRRTALLLAFWILCGTTPAQTSDNAFKKPLKEVIDLIQSRYKVKIRYSEALVTDRWVTYAEWRFRPDVKKTMTNIFASHDITFAKEGKGKYKLQDFQIPCAGV